MGYNNDKLSQEHKTQDSLCYVHKEETKESVIDTIIARSEYLQTDPVIDVKIETYFANQQQVVQCITFWNVTQWLGNWYLNIMTELSLSGELTKFETDFMQLSVIAAKGMVIQKKTALI